MMLSKILEAMRGQQGTWTASVGEDWLQGRTVFGGLQAAIAVRAMRGLVPADLPLRTLQTTFIAPVPAGTIRVEARLLRAGKSAQHLEARLYDGEQLACLAIGIFGSGRESAIAVAPSLQPPARAFATLPDLPYIPGVTPVFTQKVQFRWAEGGVPFSSSPTPRTRIYVAMRDEPQVDEAQVIALADTIPSPGLSLLKKPTPASSLTWTLEILRPRWSAQPGPWLMDAEVGAAGEGYMSQSATLWSAAGEAVAYSRQSVVVFG